MMIAAWIFVGLLALVACFQLALACGAPLGAFTLGGKHKGRLPANLRLAALFQIVILAIFAMIVLAKAQMAFAWFHDFSKVGIWVIVVFFVLGNVMNWSSSSKKERYIMGPANSIALICAVVIALWR